MVASPTSIRRTASLRSATADFLERWGIDANLFDCIPERMLDHYRRIYSSVLISGVEWQHGYRCPTPASTRRFSLRVHPVWRGENIDGFIDVHRLLWAAPHDFGLWEQRGGPDFEDASGLIVQCAECRHVQRQQNPEQWDYVMSYVSAPRASITHDLCPMCEHKYRGES